MEAYEELWRSLAEAGTAEELIARYRHYLASGDKQGQRRMLQRFRRMENERLQKDREKLACLDYIISKVEKTSKLYGDSKKYK